MTEKVFLIRLRSFKLSASLFIIENRNFGNQKIQVLWYNLVNKIMFTFFFIGFVGTLQNKN